jgi:hypothetical protein
VTVVSATYFVLYRISWLVAIDGYSYRQGLDLIPVAIALSDQNHNAVANAVATLTVDGTVPYQLTAAGCVRSSAMPHYGPVSSGIYAAALCTGSLSVGTHHVEVHLDDGTTHTATVTIR